MIDKFKKRVVLTVADGQKFVTDYDAFNSTVTSPLIGGNGKAQLNIDVYTFGGVDFVKVVLGRKSPYIVAGQHSFDDNINKRKYYIEVKSMYYHMIRISDIIEMSIEDVCFKGDAE